MKTAVKKPQEKLQGKLLTYHALFSVYQKTSCFAGVKLKLW